MKVEKEAFDAVLRKMINAHPVPLVAFPERVYRGGVNSDRLKLDLGDPEDAGNDRTSCYDSLRATPEKREALIRIAVEWVAARLRSRLER